MRRVWAVAFSEWLYVVRDRISLLMLLLLPIIFTTVLGLIFGGAGNMPLRIAVVPGDTTLTTEVLTAIELDENLSYRQMSREQAERDIRRGHLDAALIVPQGPEPMRVMTDTTTQRGYEAFARLMGLQSALSGRQTAESFGQEFLTGPDARRAAGEAYASATLPAVKVERTWRLVAEGVLQVSPGMLVMFILMFAAYSGEGIVQERINGTLRRLHAAPVSGWEYVSGRLLGKVALGMVQFVLLALFGALVFRVNWGGAPGAMLTTGLIFTMSCAAFGMLLGVVCRTPDQLSSTATTVCLALAALGGTWWPLEAAPEFMQVLGRLLPTGQAMQAFHALILYGPRGVAEAQQAWFYMALWGISFLVPAAVLFRFEWSPKASTSEGGAQA